MGSTSAILYSANNKIGLGVFFLFKSVKHQTSTSLLRFVRKNWATPCRKFESYCPCQKTGGNTAFLPVFFFYVLYGCGAHTGSDSGFSHPFAPVRNRSHPLQHPKRTRLRLFSPEIGCVSLFLPSFDLQNFRLCFCASCRIAFTD